MRRLLICLLSLLLLVGSVGCMQSLSIGDYAYVLNIGVAEGETMPFSVCFLVAMPEGGKATDASTTLKLLSAEARTVYEAIETLNATLSRRLNFSRVFAVFVQEKLAKEDRMMEFFDFPLGKLDLWLNLRVLIAKDDVRSVLEGVVSESDPSLGKLKSNIGYLADRSGLTVDVSFSEMTEFFNNKTGDVLLAYCGANAYELRSDLVGDDAYPYLGGSLLTESDLKTSIMGSAVFDGTKMVGTLNGRHTMLVMMVNGRFEMGRLPFGDGEKPMTVSFRKLRPPKIEMQPNGITVRIYLEGDVDQPYDVTLEELEAIRMYLEQELASELDAVIKVLQKANSDAMGFGRYAVRSFRTTEEWEKYDWKAVYRTIPVSFSVSVRMSGSSDML